MIKLQSNDKKDIDNIVPFHYRDISNNCTDGKGTGKSKEQWIELNFVNRTTPPSLVAEH